jgi:gamma-glutamyl phosphate reductase
MKKCLKSGIYERMQKFSDITVWLVLNNKTQRASKCLEAAEKLFVSGSVQMRNAITVVYIYHLAAVLEFHHYDLKGMLPQSLYREYIRISSFGL